MSDPFVAEISIFSFNFAPRGWAECNGQLMPISQNTALFALLGTMYSGDGKSTFGLPDLAGRSPLMWQQGPGLSHYQQGQRGGDETVTLTEANLPPHAHQLQALPGTPASRSPADAGWAGSARAQVTHYAAGDQANVQMSSAALSPSGSGMPHENRQPYLGLKFCIALQGIFPPRS